MTLLTPGVSFFGQTQAQTKRLGDLNNTLADLTRQMTTQKKYTTFSGFGTNSLNIQRLHMDKTLTDSYLTNLNTVSLRMNLMTDSLTRGANAGRDLLNSLTTGQTGDANDVQVMKQVAANNIVLMKDYVNQQTDGRYLFSGDATTTKPLSESAIDTATLKIQGMFSDWQNGTITTAQLMTQMDSLTPEDLGFDPQLSSAGPVSARIDDGFNMDYTSIASKNGFQDVFKAMMLAANFDQPDPAASPPGPTQDDYEQVKTAIVNLTSKGIKETDQSGAALSTSYAYVQTSIDNHTSDAGLYANMIGGLEDADTTDVVARIQTLQTQLQASYQVTGIVSQLSLVNYL